MERGKQQVIIFRMILILFCLHSYEKNVNSCNNSNSYNYCNLLF